MSLKRYFGGCHCKTVRFSLLCEDIVEVERCNCSICSKLDYLHLIIPKAQFKLEQGEDSLTEYSFNTGVAKHYFCKHCGIKSFYIPRSNPDGVSVNARCLDTPTPTLQITEFDGQNWEQNAHTLAHKTQQ